MGNRAHGERLGADVSPAAFRAMSALLLLSPYTPLLFMGQEWNASTPFLYFTDHNAELGKLVTEGRRKEFAGFTRFAGDDGAGSAGAWRPSRARSSTGARRERPEHAGVLALYRELLRLRATDPCLKECRRGHFDARPTGEHGLVLERRGPEGALHVILNVRGTLEHRLPGRSPERSEVVLWTEAPRFGGTSQEAPLRSGVVRLEGPAAVVVRVTD